MWELPEITGRFKRIQKLDIKAVMYIQENLRSDLRDTLMRFFTRLGNGGTVWLFAALCLWFMPNGKQTSVSILSVLLVGILTGNLIIKNMSSRTRSYDLFDRQPLIKPLKDYSFPSCHSMSSFASAVMICYYSVPLGLAALGVAAMIALSRLYLFVHYPSDVIAGTLWGITIAIWTHGMLVAHFFETIFSFG